MTLEHRLVHKLFEHFQADDALDFGVDGENIELAGPEQAEHVLVVVVIRYTVSPDDFIIGGQGHRNLRLRQLSSLHDRPKDTVAPAVAVVAKDKPGLLLQDEVIALPAGDG